MAYEDPIEARTPIKRVHSGDCICTDCESVRTDAARYRWLKKQVRIIDEDGGWASYFRLPMIACHNDSPNARYTLKRRTLDEAIDGSMATRVRKLQSNPGN